MLSIVGLGSRDDAAGSEVAKSSVTQSQWRWDPLAALLEVQQVRQARIW